MMVFQTLEDKSIYLPTAGPKKGAKRNKLMATPREEGWNMSAIVPPPIDSAGAAKKPANSLQMMMVPMF